METTNSTQDWIATRIREIDFIWEPFAKKMEREGLDGGDDYQFRKWQNAKVERRILIEAREH